MEPQVILFGPFFTLDFCKTALAVCFHRQMDSENMAAAGFNCCTSLAEALFTYKLIQKI